MGKYTEPPERYTRALRKRIYACVEAGLMTAEHASVVLTCKDKRYYRARRGLTVEKLPRP